MKQSYLKLSFVFFILISILLGVNCTMGKKGKRPKAPEEELPIVVTATYYKYQTAMGKGKGMVFQVNFINKGSLGVDSIIIGGRPMVFSPIQGKANSYEINWQVSRPEPTPEQPNPKMPADPIIDTKEFQPAYCQIRLNGQNFKIPILQFTDASNK